jgi:hypothetical protein
MIETWKSWLNAFNQACADDNWEALTPFLREDVIYAVSGAPFSCEIRGRDAVINGFAKSIRNFDRRFDARHWYAVGVRVWEPSAITARAMGRYELAGAPEITFSARSQWFFRDGSLSLMTDVYDTAEADVVATLEMLSTFGEGFDPSYV